MTPMQAFAIVSDQQPDPDDLENTEKVLEAWEVLVESGYINTLPGSYGRTAQSPIERGLIG